MSAVREIVEAHLNNYGDKGYKVAAEQIVGLVEKGKIEPRNVSTRDLFNNFVLRKYPDLKLDGPMNQEFFEAVVSSQFPYATSRVISPVIIKQYEYALADVGRLVTEVDSKNDAEDIVGFRRKGKFERVYEGRPYEQVDRTEKRCRIKNAKFGEIISLTKEMILFDKTGELVNDAQDLGEEMGSHRHRFIIEKATDRACDATGDAVNNSLVIDGTARAMFADTHAAWDTYANDNVDTTAFGTAGVKAVLKLLRKMQDERGEYIGPFVVEDLLVHSDLEIDAMQLIKSTQQYDTTDRSINPFKGKYTIVSSPFVRDVGYYYLGTFRKQTRWQWVWRPTITKLAEASDDNFKRDIVLQIKASYYGGCGATDYRYAAEGGS